MTLPEPDPDVWTFPVWGSTLTQYASNPIVPHDLETGTSADPFLIPDTVHGESGTLFMVRENVHTAGDPQIMVLAKSTDRGHTWGTWSVVSHGAASTYHHPCIVVDGSTVHVFYTETKNLSPSYGKLWHRTCTLTDFLTTTPTWSAAAEIFDGGAGSSGDWGPSNAETTRMNTCLVFMDENGRWWLIAGAQEDVVLHAYWSDTFTTDWWNANYVGKVFDCNNDPVLGRITHPRTTLLPDGTRLLTVGISAKGAGLDSQLRASAAVVNPSATLADFTIDMVSNYPTIQFGTLGSHCWHVVEHDGEWVAVCDRAVNQWDINLLVGRAVV